MLRVLMAFVRELVPIRVQANNVTGKIGQCGAELVLGEQQPDLGVFEQELESLRWQFGSMGR